MVDQEKENLYGLRRVVNWTAGFIAILVATAMPAGYFYTAYEYESDRILAESDQIADVISEMVYSNPAMWRFEEHKLAGLLASRRSHTDGAVHRVMGAHNVVLAEVGTLPPPPTIIRQSDLLDGTTLVGVVEIEESLRTLLIRTGYAGLFGVFLATAMFIALRLLPLRALRKTLDQLEVSHDRLNHLAYHDVLTGLPNRVLFIDRLNQALIHVRQNGRKMAVLFVDLDDFKWVNDSEGHGVGDKLLREVGERISSTIWQDDTLARFGGDEFVISLPKLNKIEDAAIVAEKIITALKAPFIINHKELFMGVSIGIGVYPDDGEDGEALLKNSDAAMYRAKAQGKNNFQVYKPEMNVNAVKRMILLNHLRKAIGRDEFVLYYQPQVDLITGEIVGAEALIRWHHPELGLVPPGEFIPLVEETNLIGPISEWVLQTACQQSKSWQDSGLAPLRVAVNLSGRQFKDKSLPHQIELILSQTGLAPNNLEIEMTEGIFMQNTEETVTVLNELKKMGLSLSLDDFGTGYSSLSYLQRFPIDVLKIDRSFISDITCNAENAAIATTIIDMGHALKMEVVAEGIETEAQLAFLQDHDCNIGQGYLFSRPLPASEFYTFYKRSQTTFKWLDEQTKSTFK